MQRQHSTGSTFKVCMFSSTCSLHAKISGALAKNCIKSNFSMLMELELLLQQAGTHPEKIIMMYCATVSWCCILVLRMSDWWSSVGWLEPARALKCDSGFETRLPGHCTTGVRRPACKQRPLARWVSHLTSSLPKVTMMLWLLISKYHTVS